MFHYEVMSEQDAMNERFQLLKEGIYDAVVTASQDTVSSKGSPMMDITLSVYDENGNTHDVRDFLVFTKQMMWKIVHFAQSAGIMNLYQNGRLCSDTAINKRVQVKLTVEQGGEIPQDKLKGKPVGTRYFDKNKVEDYIKQRENISTENNLPPFMDYDMPSF